ncbi:ATP-binding protein [Telmatospirillum siberiense]|nr:ATP-binding protein [Telmatospirillum siberiense]
MTAPKIVPTVVCNRRGTPRLCGIEVPADLQALVVERTTCPNDNPECACKPVVSVVGGVDEAGMERALSDFGGCVEVAYGQLLSGEHLLSTLERHGLYMALSTATAYSLAPAHMFCNVLAERHHLSPELRDAIELAVHEAVVNGLLHGNLEIGSGDRQSLEGLRRFGETISTQLRDPSLASRRIEVTAVVSEREVELAVIDSGPGYEAESLAADDRPDRKSGRGLELIRHFAQAVEVGEGGRKLRMRFAR